VDDGFVVGVPQGPLRSGVGHRHSTVALVMELRAEYFGEEELDLCIAIEELPT
jgi:hypothetical protein